MDVLRLELEGKILDTLKASGLDWLATGDAAIGTLLNKQIPPPQFVIYIPSNQLIEWSTYLKSCGAVEMGKSPIPSLVVIPENDFNTLADGVHQGVRLVKYNIMLRDANPRYLENMQSELEAYLSKKIA